jgi:serine-type D-Ala-D-Ala carboxypeptidase (penicillin-binding protein 5/6)
MRRRSLIVYCSLFTALFLLFASGCSREIPTVEVDINARAAVIMDARTGRVLFEKSSGERYPPASTAKVMTAIVAIENLPLDSDVTPSAKALRVEPTIVGLKPGVTYKLRDLISAILIKSGNDAARAIAEKVAGSEENFAVMMNEKAREIGMENTYFQTASGLPTGKKDSQYTTAEDLAKMMRYASRYEVILTTMSRKDATIKGANEEKIYLKTHNRSLLRQDDAPWGKTGYTREARRTFAGIDPSTEPKIVFGLLKSDALWDDITTLKDKGLEIYELSRRSILADISDWVRAQRFFGKTSFEELLENKK